MRSLSSLRIAAVALSLATLVSGATVSFADTAAPASQQQAMQPAQSQANSASPYDSPDFVLQSNNIHN